MKLLVTGGAGFIGSNYVRWVLEHTDDEVVAGFRLLSETEGIIPALECAHAVAWIKREAPNMQGQTGLMNLSGRGDKDVAQMMDILAAEFADDSADTAGTV